jgi:hypothetical protein
MMELFQVKNGRPKKQMEHGKIKVAIDALPFIFKNH